jgi:steroid delta-isomerase-like uncharacterized protein
MNKPVYNLIQAYYTFFNQGNFAEFLNLLSEDVIHEINQGEVQIGKAAFSQFMDHMNRCYQEQVKDLCIMVDANGQRAAAEFMIEGVYIKTDAGLPEAKNQKYSLQVGAFFAIANNKITRITNYYNLNDWLKQVNSWTQN